MGVAPGSQGQQVLEGQLSRRFGLQADKAAHAGGLPICDVSGNKVVPHMLARLMKLPDAVGRR